METVYESPEDYIHINTIENLPDEVLEFIFSFIPPYNDLHHCKVVCKRWYNCVHNVMRKTSIKLVKAITEFNVLWKNVTPTDMTPSITKRFSHSACIIANSMYIFGGCTTNATAFNDLWRFDLSKRRWVRPLATGTYPVPKAYTSMVSYRDNLILFGGWTYPSPSQHYQNVTMFNEIHFYNIICNKWILVNAENCPPPMAGHSACIRGNEMIVFGGLVKSVSQQQQIQCSNDVWVLDLQTLAWRQQPTTKPKPSPRYAQSLLTLDDERLLLLGGAQTFFNRFVYSDCWILSMAGPMWTWKEIAVKNKEWAASNIWCNPACRVGDKVVSLSRSRNGWNCAKPLVTSAVRLASMGRPEGSTVSVRIEQSLRRPLDRDQNINGKRGVLPHHGNSHRQENNSNQPVAGPSNEHIPPQSNKDSNDVKDAELAVASGSSSDKKTESMTTSQTSPGLDLTNNKDLVLKRNKQININRNNGMKIVRQLQEANKYRMAAFACDPPSSGENDLVNQRQIAQLENRQEQVPPPLEPQIQQPAVKKVKRNTLSIHVLDIATLMNGNSLNYVSWLCPRLGEMSGAPEELVMYSLVKGNGELIMFGGVHNDITNINVSPHQHLYSNSIHFITPPKDII